MSTDTPISLRDPLYFPSFSACPPDSSLINEYYKTTDGESFQPSRHWCLLAEVLKVERFVRLRFIAQDLAGGRIVIALHAEDGVAPHQ